MRTPRQPQRFPWRDGNRFEILSQGTTFFPLMLSSIAEARTCIALEIYWIASDRTADRFIQALAQAARRGVQVFVLLDDYGCSDLETIDRHRLTEAGVHLALFNPLRLRVGWGMFVRDHRKLLLVDDHVAFVGGAGICDPFDGANGWRENMLRVEGDCVADWWHLFRRVWSRCSRITCPPSSGKAAGRARGRILPGTPVRRSVLASALTDINHAHQRVWLVTPYFLPPKKLRRALARACRRNCDVRLLVPDEDHCDVPAVQAAGRRYYDWLLRRGVRVLEYSERTTHQKVLLADDRVTIGSCNYDRWGLRWNLEASQGVDSAALAGEALNMLERDMVACREVTLADRERQPLYGRLREWFWGWVDATMVNINHLRLIRNEKTSRR